MTSTTKTPAQCGKCHRPTADQYHCSTCNRNRNLCLSCAETTDRCPRCLGHMAPIEDDPCSRGEHDAWAGISGQWCIRCNKGLEPKAEAIGDGAAEQIARKMLRDQIGTLSLYIDGVEYRLNLDYVRPVNNTGDQS